MGLFFSYQAGGLGWYIKDMENVKGVVRSFGSTNDSNDRDNMLMFWLDIVFVPIYTFFSFFTSNSFRKTVTCMIRNGIVEWKSFSYVVCTCGGDIFS